MSLHSRDVKNAGEGFPRVSGDEPQPLVLNGWQL